jgi:hypothetical protein
MASAAFSVNGVAYSTAVAVAGASTVNLAVLSLTGVDSVEWTVTANSGSALTNPTITPAGSPSGATASFAMPASGGYMIRCRVNAGRSDQTESRGIVGVANANGRVPFVVGETTERHATYGYTQDLNSMSAAAGGGGSLPSGFGGQVLVRNVGSGDPEFAELLDANIDAAAAIAGTKVSPNFGAQNVVTTGFVAAGASPATAGTLRIGHAQAFQGLDQAGTGNEMLITWGIDGNDVMGLGSTSNAGMLYASGTSGALAGHHFYVGGTEYVTIDAGTMNLADGFVITWTDDSGPTTRRLLSVTEESLRIGDSTGSNGPYRIDLYAESGVRTHVNDAERFAVVDSGPAWDCIQHIRSEPTQTTDATVTTLASVAPGNTKAGRISVVVTAREATTQVVNIYSIQQSYETDGSGNVTLRGSPTVVAEDEDNAAWACALTVEIASPTVISVRVTGEAATTINWRCAGQIMVA